jgi:hypothetical protein
MCNPSEEFTDSETFAEHIKLVHHETVPTDEIPTVLSMLSLSSPGTVSSCPLCRWADAEPSRHVEPNSLLEHIAEHLHSLSLRSLPWPAPSEEINKVTYANPVGESNLNDWLEDQLNQPPSDEPGEERSAISTILVQDHIERAAEFFDDIAGAMSKDLDEELTQDNYFHKNAYFGDSTQRSSTANNQNDRDTLSYITADMPNVRDGLDDDHDKPSPEAPVGSITLSQPKVSILSLDGGGMRSLSMLLVLKNLMYRLNESHKGTNLERIKPCQVFDLIAGAGMGGYVLSCICRYRLTAQG